MKRLAFFILFIITIFIFKEQASAQSFSILHSFGSSSDDGQYPFDNVILSGNTSYGMTINGGANNLGTIFKVNKDGSDYSVLHSFEGDASDGSNPRGTLLLSDGILYGMTNSNNGAIFKLNTDGSGFTILHSFSRSVDDGRNPAGTLIISDGVLYGTTYLSNNYGTVFSIKTDGSRFSILHNFTGMPDDGSYPTGSLLLSDNTLYGTTMNGGTSDNGTIFKINIDVVQDYYKNKLLKYVDYLESLNRVEEE